MNGATFGQPFAHGRTLQRTFRPGNTAFGFPALTTGASYTATLHNFDYWRLVAFRCALTTDANAANRVLTIRYSDGSGNIIAEDGADLLVTASTTAQVFDGLIGLGHADWDTGTPVWFPLSGLWLENAYTVAINIASVQAGDALTLVNFTFDVAKVPNDGTAEADAAAYAARNA